MEKEVLNSCIMLAVNLDTPVCFGCVFDDADLKDTGVELDSHITISYAQGKIIPKENLIEDFQTILGEYWPRFEERIKSTSDINLLDIFEIGSFENDSDYIILKLKRDTEIFKDLSLVNKGLGIKYDIKSDFKNYTPHITLAELNPGTAKKYVGNETLLNILKDSSINFEDLMISYGTDNEPGDRKQIFLTQEKCVSRYFRLEGLRKEYKALIM